MKRCSVWLAIRQMQIKTSEIPLYIQEEGFWKILSIPSVDKDAEQLELSLIASENTKL